MPLADRKEPVNDQINQANKLTPSSINRQIQTKNNVYDEYQSLRKFDHCV